jgi:signal transduction histidine kinase
LSLRRCEVVVGAGSLEDLVMAMSTELLGVDAADLAATIRGTLERLAYAVDADRAYVLKTNVEGRSAGEAFEEWWAPGIERRNTPIPALPLEAQRFWMRTLRSGEVVHAEDVEALEDRCFEAAEALRSDGVRSILFLPLMAKEQTVGFIGFERRRESSGWDPTTVSRLRTVGELIVGSVERCHADVERAAFTRDLADRNAELERSNRELQQFASIVSHDLTQPLVVVEGFVHELKAIALEHPTRGEQAESYGGAAERATRRMRALIDDVLSVARAGAPLGKPEPVDLGAVVQDVLDDLEAGIADAVATVTVGQMPVVEGNPTQLRQLFQNLLANAIKFRRADRAPEIAVSAAQAGWGWVISVADNGPGINPDEREAVFEMFKRSATDAPGLGIGLAVCAKVVTSHHGEIWVDETDGGGCTVCVRLPSRQPDA